MSVDEFDDDHGTASENTSFRNWLVGTSFVCSPAAQPISRTAVTCSPGAWTNQANRAIDVQALIYTTNIVGDVVGSAVFNALGTGVPIIQWPTTRNYTNAPYGVSFGYATSGDSGSSSFDNTTPFTSAFIHGLYNSINSSTTWSGVVTHTLPASFYLSSKPNWWGSMPWPPIGPDVTGGTLISGQGAGASPGGHVNVNPAMYCFYHFMGGAEGGAGSPLAFDPTACYVATSGGAPDPPTGLSVVVQ